MGPSMSVCLSVCSVYPRNYATPMTRGHFWSKLLQQHKHSPLLSRLLQQCELRSLLAHIVKKITSNRIVVKLTLDKLLPSKQLLHFFLLTSTPVVWREALRWNCNLLQRGDLSNLVILHEYKYIHTVHIVLIF
jgi:hypothetical protein